MPYADKTVRHCTYVLAQNGNGDGIRTREHLIESQGRNTHALCAVTWLGKWESNPPVASLPTRVTLPLVRSPSNGRNEGTRTLGHLVENQGRLAYNLNIPTDLVGAEGFEPPF